MRDLQEFKSSKIGLTFIKKDPQISDDWEKGFEKIWAGKWDPDFSLGAPGLTICINLNSCSMQYPYRLTKRI